jgi:putative acetyltransferase
MAHRRAMLAPFGRLLLVQRVREMNWSVPLDMLRDAFQTGRRALNVTIAVEPFDSPDAGRLVGALDAELSLLYKPEQRFGPNLKPEHLSPGLGTFVLARAEGRAVGCGALRRLDSTTGEVKRMYVEPEVRGRGVAKQILDRLEAAARELTLNRLVLETGIHQADAIALYTRAGFRPVPCWDEYAGSSTSVCYEKLI